MNKVKLIMLIIVVLGILVALYYWLPNKKATSLNVIVTVLENKELKIYLPKIVDNVVEQIMLNEPNEINFKIQNVMINTNSVINLKMKFGDREKEWKSKIKENINGFLTNIDTTTLTNQSTNELIFQSVKQFTGSDAGSSICFITGSFPSCYNDKAAQELKKKLNTIKTNSDKENIIIWSVLDTRLPEESILNSFTKYKLANKIFDYRIIYPESRVCIDKNSIQVFAAFFDSLNDEQAKEFLNYLKLTYGNSVKLKIWNDSELNNRILNLNLKDSILRNDIEILKQIKKCNWTSIGYLFKQSINEFKQLPISVEKNFIITGNMPREERGSQLDSSVWDYWKNDSLTLITLYIPKGKITNQIDRDIKRGFVSYGIKYKLIEN